MSDDTFLPRGVREEPVRELDRVDARTAHRVFRGVDGFEVAIPERILTRAIAIGESHAPLEWIGQLVGTRYRDDRGRHAVVEAIVQDLGAKREPHFVTSTHASEGRTKALVREQYPDAIILGWIHGHVRHGVRYSRRDFENQATWTDPDSIGIVVDPWDPARLAVYRGPAGELLAHAVPGEPPPSAAEPVRVAPSGDATTHAPKASPGQRKRRRPAMRSLLLEIAAFAVGVWMGWTDVRLRAVSAAIALASATHHAVPVAPAEPRLARCDHGIDASEYVEGPSALQCHAPPTPSCTLACNAITKRRMRVSDTPR